MNNYVSNKEKVEVAWWWYNWVISYYIDMW